MLLSVRIAVSKLTVSHRSTTGILFNFTSIMAKKSKKGKKSKNEEKGPEPVTTMNIIQERTKMLCPRYRLIGIHTTETELIS